MVLKNSENGVKECIYYKYCFLWDTFFNSAKYLLLEPTTSQGDLNIRLFDVYVKYYDEGFYYENIYERKRLDNHCVTIDFQKVNKSTVKTNVNSFNFIFWTRAEDYMDKELPERGGQRIVFQNENEETIVVFDYSSEKGYQLKKVMF
jgi:hypothetical protein